MLLTVSIVWVQSQGHASEAWCSLHSVLCQPVGERPNNADRIFLEHKLVNHDGKSVSHGSKEKETLANTHCRLSRQS